MLTSEPYESLQAQAAVKVKDMSSLKDNSKL